MRVYICENCRRTAFMSRKRKFTCIKCERDMVGLPVLFEDWWYKDKRQRDKYIDNFLTIPPNKRRNNPKRKPKVALGQLENYDIVALNKRRNSPKIKSKVKIQKKDDIDKN
ncbi:MAG: hypothetical protein HFI05_10945 [Lachnospiraceae bacterium]|jgi:hypothetical protein|nr:hypothetical protein [Lachnospiraceae bacterium]